MKQVDRETFAKILKEHRIKPRLVRDIRFVPEEVTHWGDREMLPVFTKGAHEGVLLIEIDDGLAIVPFERGRRIVDAKTGKSKPITCDFCKTWQRGSNAAIISFQQSNGRSRGYLCCADLNCSAHVRNLTPESVLSRTQLHEDISTEGRVQRLQNFLRTFIAQIS